LTDFTLHKNTLSEKLKPLVINTRLHKEVCF
jgi:hypothetical protein